MDPNRGCWDKQMTRMEHKCIFWDISEYITVDHKTKVLDNDGKKSRNTVMKRLLNHVAVVRRQNLRKPNYEASLSTQGKGLKDNRKSYETMNAKKIAFPKLRQIIGEILCSILKNRAEILEAIAGTSHYSPGFEGHLSHHLVQVIYCNRAKHRTMERICSTTTIPNKPGRLEDHALPLTLATSVFSSSSVCCARVTVWCCWNAGVCTDDDVEDEDDVVRGNFRSVATSGGVLMNSIRPPSTHMLGVSGYVGRGGGAG